MAQKLLIAVALVCVFASGVAAGPIVSGDLALISLPSSLLPGALTSDTTAFLIPEALQLKVTASLSSLWGIATGTLVDVWLIHSDPVSNRGEYSGSVEFGKDILHVDTLASAISAADPLLASGTAYATGDGWRGIGPKDTLTVSGARTADFSFITITGVDEARIITAAETPEPATLSLVGAGAALLGLASRRRARRKVCSSLSS